MIGPANSWRFNDIGLSDIEPNLVCREVGIVRYIYLAVTFAGVAALVFAALVVLESAIGG